jgi:hypothetical protein
MKVYWFTKRVGGIDVDWVGEVRLKRLAFNKHIYFEGFVRRNATRSVRMGALDRWSAQTASIARKAVHTFAGAVYHCSLNKPFTKSHRPPSVGHSMLMSWAAWSSRLAQRAVHEARPSGQAATSLRPPLCVYTGYTAGAIARSSACSVCNHNSFY